MSALDEQAVPGTAPKDVLRQAARRRTFAVISHPDAGKSTLTEALALHARVIGQAGAVHGKAGRRGTVSDWMDMEKARGISITSAALQFEYGDAVINLLDTPGHADFSEDTYRVLTAVDAAVMLIDAAKGLEAQTMKLFAVCRHRGIPVLTVVNKWDRPGKDALELLDEIAERTGLIPTPLTWPVGIAGDFRGVLDRSDGTYRRFTRTAGGATIAPEETLSADAALAREGDAWQQAVEEVELLEATGADHEQSLFLDGATTPVLFASAVSNFGVGALLDTLVGLAPPPSAQPDADGAARALTEPFSAFVFKVQAGMDSAHRDRLAFIRICSGVFERGMVVTHARTGRPFATKYAQHVFGRERESIDVAYPGDVVGSGERRRARRRRHALRRAAGDLPAADHLRARALRGLPRPGHRQAQAVPPRASSSWTPRASSRSCAPTAAATRRRCSRWWARCSSRSRPTAWSTSSARRSTSIGCRTAWRCAPTRPRCPGSRPPGARRCCSGPTASCSRCSRTSGGCGCCSRTSRNCSSSRWSRPSSADRYPAGPSAADRSRHPLRLCLHR